MRIRVILVGLLLALAACGREVGAPDDPSGVAAPAPPVAVTPPALSGSRSAVTDEERARPPEGAPGVPQWLRTANAGFEVVVADEAGRPVAGARVSHPKSSAITDDAGRAALGRMGYDIGSPGNDRFWKTVTVHADGYLPVARAHPWDADGIARFRLVDRGRPIAGRVVDESGRGLPGIGLKLRAEGFPTIPLTTDEHGAFATRQAPPSVATLRVTGPGYFADSVQVVPPEEGVELVAWPVCVVRGHVKLAPGTTMPEDLEIRAEGHRGAAYVYGRSFTIWCRPGPVVLRVGDRTVARLHVAAGETVDDVTIDLGAWVPAAVPDATHSISPREPASWIEVQLPAGVTERVAINGCFDDLGWQRLGMVEGGAWVRLPLWSKRLTAISVWGRATGVWRQPAFAASRIAIERPSLSRVRALLEGDAGEAIAHGCLFLRWPGSRVIARKPYDTPDSLPGSDDDQPRNLLLDRVGPGVYDLVWVPKHGGGHVFVREDVVVPREESMVDLGTLRLPPPAALRVRVLDEEGAGVAGAVVNVEEGYASRSLRTDATGEIALPVQDPVDLEVTVEADGYARSTRILGPDDLDRPVIVVIERESR